MSITRKGKAWEWLQSWWVLFAIPGGIFTFLGFLYAGVRARTHKWLLWGAVYFAATVGVLIVTNDQETSNQWISVVLFFWIFGLVHTFRARPEFLMRLEALQSPAAAHTREEMAEAMRREIAAEYGVPAQPAPAFQPEPARAAAPLPPPSPFAAPPQAAGFAATPGGGVDLNSASEAELMALPGVGPMLARRVVRARESTGGFASMDDFGRALSLAPDFVDRLRPHVSLGARAGVRTS